MQIEKFKYADITEELPKEHLAPLNPDYESWSTDGVVVLNRFIPSTLIDDYSMLWMRENQQRNRMGGFPDCCPYLRHDEIKNLGLYPQLMDVLKRLVGEDVGMHLNLTGWVSTERNFHADMYLNPPGVGTFYVAIWIALDDVHPDSGPFEYVPGSHLWPAMSRDLLFRFVPPHIQADDRWPTFTQDAVASACEEEIERRRAVKKQFLGKKGDVLVWHSNLLHRGTKPKDPTRLRKSFIAHYSGLNHRHDMPRRAQHEGGGWYYVLESNTRV